MGVLCCLPALQIAGVLATRAALRYFLAQRAHLAGKLFHMLYKMTAQLPLLALRHTDRSLTLLVCDPVLLCVSYAVTLAMRLSIVGSPCVDAPRSHCRALCITPGHTACKRPQPLAPTPTFVLTGLTLMTTTVVSCSLSVRRSVHLKTTRLQTCLHNHPLLKSRTSRTPTTQVISPSRPTQALPLSSLAALLRCQAARRSTNQSGRTVLSSMSPSGGGFKPVELKTASSL